MEKRKLRQLTVLDAMVLIGATAVGLAWTRMTFDYGWGELTADGNVEPQYIVQALWKWSDLTVPCLTLWTITLMLLWFRSPRPPLRKLSRYPGAVACAAVTVSIVVTIVFNLVFYLMASLLPRVHSEWFFWLPNLLSRTEDELSFYARSRSEVIAICWVILWISGRWRAQPTWLDRLSRLVAVLWLIVGLPHYWFPLT